MGCDIIVIDMHAGFSGKKTMFDEWDAMHICLL